MRHLRCVGLAVGVGLLLWILRAADLSAVFQQVRNFHWRFGVVALFYGIIFGLDTLGWQFALDSRSRAKVPWNGLFRIRLAGEAINYVTPTAWIGGEPVKAALLSKRYGIPLAEGMASIVIAKTTFVLSMLLFILLGLVVTLLTQSVEAGLLRWVWVVLPLLSVLVVLFVAVQFLQPFQRAASILRKIAPGWFEKIRSNVQESDRAIVAFYRQSRGALLKSLGFHFLGWVAGVMEVYLILHFLHVPVSFSTAWSIEALWVLLKGGAFLIPASLGVSEGFLLLICIAVGINGVSALALGLLRRARELLWVALGLVEFARG